MTAQDGKPSFHKLKLAGNKSDASHCIQTKSKKIRRSQRLNLSTSICIFIMPHQCIATNHSLVTSMVSIVVHVRSKVEVSGVND